MTIREELLSEGYTDEYIDKASKLLPEVIKSPLNVILIPEFIFDMTIDSGVK